MRACLFAAVLLACPAIATPPPPPPAHDSDRAHCALLGLVADFNKRDASVFARIRVVADREGVVGQDRGDEFYSGLLGTGGGPLELVDWGLVRQSQARATYVVSLGNDKFEAGHIVATGEPVYVYRHQSRWFLSFYSSHIVEMREVGDLELLAEEATKTPVCVSVPN